MLYPLKDYFWPANCPRCRRKMSLLDKVLRSVTTVASITSLFRGKDFNRKVDYRKCEFCQNKR